MRKILILLMVLLLCVSFFSACRRRKPPTTVQPGGLLKTPTPQAVTVATTGPTETIPPPPLPTSTPTQPAAQETREALLRFLLATLESATKTAQVPTQELAAAQEAATQTALPTSTPTPTQTPLPTAVPTLTQRPTSYVVQRGDSVYRLALRFRVRVETLAGANNLAPPYEVGVGQVLVIPPVEAVATHLYRVHTNDTLAGIGRKFGVDWRTLAKINGIGSPYGIKIGQEIIIPVKSPPQQTPVPATSVPVPTATLTPMPAASLMPTATPKWSHYESQHGDYALDYPPTWQVVVSTLQHQVMGQVLLSAFTTSAVAHVGATEVGIYRLGPLYADPQMLHAHFRGVLKDVLPGTSPTMVYGFNWEADMEETIGGWAGRRARANMVIQTGGEIPSTISMQIYLGVVIHGGNNYAVYAKAPISSWPTQWEETFAPMLRSLVIRAAQA